MQENDNFEFSNILSLSNSFRFLISSIVAHIYLINGSKTMSIKYLISFRYLINAKEKKLFVKFHQIESVKKSHVMKMKIE